MAYFSLECHTKGHHLQSSSLVILTSFFSHLHPRALLPVRSSWVEELLKGCRSR